MKIPHEQLSPATLQALIEEFVTRSGTDYGETEIPLAQKVQHVTRQLERGDIAIVFDSETESCNIVRASEVPVDDAG
jgi:uncharacterized protein YheU (UPF0270 family)